MRTSWGRGEGVIENELGETILGRNEGLGRGWREYFLG